MGPAKPINRPSEHHVEVATGNALHQGVEARACVTVFKNAHHEPSVAAGDAF
jgi:hypothetical protein